MTSDATSRRHWIYALGGEDVREEAHRWQRAKSAAGKSYEVICASLDESPSGTLKPVANDDVVYVYARATENHPDAVGQTGKGPRELADLLKAEGLNPRHQDLKLFLSESAGESASTGPGSSYAERLYHCMKETHPNLVVYGYFGEVTPAGFFGHKTAGLEPGEPVESLTAEAWRARGLRANQNRVRFPPESGELT